MSNATSLTDAVKAAATKGASLTDAVKEAARGSADGTVISFPRAAADVRHETAVPIARQAAVRFAGAAGPGGGARADIAADTALEAAPEPAGEARIEEPALAAPRSRRLRLRPNRPKARPILRPLRRIRDALPGRQALRAMANSVRLAGLRLAAVASLAILSLVATPSPVGPDRPFAAPAQKRVALVIGNSAYRFTRRLENPRNDALDIGAVLQRLGFHVIEGFDLDKPALDAKIREFTLFLRGADVGVFFYAGHGLHVAGQNYLVPIDAQLTSATALDLELVRLDLVHRAMEQQAHTNVLFFDACRDSPLPDNLARAMGTRSVEVGRGLGVVHGGAGTLISFSTQPGTLALDGKGRNSPYSAALARHLATSHEDLGTMLIAVRNDVMKATDSKQVPWEHSALTRQFRFNPAPEAAHPAPTAAPRSREAFEAWSVARDTTSLAVLKAFIARYGDTFYAELARARLHDLQKPSASMGLPPVVELAPSFDP